MYVFVVYDLCDPKCEPLFQLPAWLPAADAVWVLSSLFILQNE